MFHQPGEATEMKITTIGIDLAKNVFHVHGVDEWGKTSMKKQLSVGELHMLGIEVAKSTLEERAGQHDAGGGAVGTKRLDMAMS